MHATIWKPQGYYFGQKKNMNSKQDRMRDEYNFSAVTILLATVLAKLRAITHPSGR